jgi:hypothetical protein
MLARSRSRSTLLTLKLQQTDCLLFVRYLYNSRDAAPVVVNDGEVPKFYAPVYAFGNCSLDFELSVSWHLSSIKYALTHAVLVLGSFPTKTLSLFLNVCTMNHDRRNIEEWSKYFRCKLIGPDLSTIDFSQ